MKRLEFIDALRGIAALGVLVAHFSGRMVLPEWAAFGAHLGTLGVPLFFVLSGFVITMSVGDRLITRSFFGRFALRRSLRLDPPYFASILVLLIIGAFGAPYGANQDLPTLGGFFAHLFYLQDLLGVAPLSPVYWSLCLEVQFYLFLLVGLALLQSGRGVVQSLASKPVQFLVVASLLLSYLCRREGIANGSFIPMWFCFGLGMITYWCSRGWFPRAPLLVLLPAGMIVGVIFSDYWVITACLSSALILLAAHRDSFDWLSGATFQFFGRISYSLYLTHNIFGWYALSVALKFMGQWQAAAMGAVVAVAAAYAWYLCIERPAIRLSRRVTMA
jgi:peptidoglycan/LPS O-acetylase OafA/YrhL